MQTPEPTPTVYLVDDDVSFLKSLARLLTASGHRVLTYPSTAEFFAQLPPGARGCVVVDLNMPTQDGLALQAELAASANPLPILFLTGHGDIVTSVRAMRGGAEDFLEKRAPKEALLAAVQRALAKDAASRAVIEQAVGARERFAALSERERQVLDLLFDGLLNKQIAGELAISERTVKLHRQAICAKVGVRSVAVLTRLAQQAGLLGHKQGS